MKKKISLAVLSYLFLYQIAINAQSSASLTGTNYIDTIDLVRYIKTMSSDEFAGRKTGEEGLKKAAAFIEKAYQAIGLETWQNNSYKQVFNLNYIEFSNIWAKKGDQTFNNLDQTVYMETQPIKSETEKEVIFVGKIDTVFLEKIDIKDKIIAAFSDNFYWIYEFIGFLDRKGAYGIFIANSQNDKEFEIIKESFGKYRFGNKRLFLDSVFDNRRNLKPAPETQKYFIFKTEGLSQLFSLDKDKLLTINNLTNPKDLPKTKVKLSCEKNIRKIATENLIGLIKGTDPKAKYVVITAHYDHEGVIDSQKYGGADDNASGVAAMLEIMENIKKNGIKPKYNILCVAVSAEEEGLLGSNYFYASFPKKEMQVVANINIDMVGRIDAKHKNNADYLYTYGLARFKVLEPYFTKALSLSKIKHDKALETSGPSGGSDHAIFMENNIPSVFFHSGLHPDYHTPKDTYDKIDYKLLKNRTDLVYYTIWNIANGNW